LNSQRAASRMILSCWKFTVFTSLYEIVISDGKKVY